MRRIPGYIKSNKGVITLFSNPKTGKPYRDNLSPFRAISWALHSHRISERVVKQIFQTFCIKKWGCVQGQTTEFDHHDFTILETLFSVSINVYKIDKERKCTTLRLSAKNFPISISLNQYKHHYSIINDFEVYACSFLCKMCKRAFSRRFNLKRHRRTCDGTHKQRHRFRKECFSKKKTIFDELEIRLGIEIPFSERAYPFFATYDIESYFKPTEIASDKTDVFACHEILSVAVSSNINQTDVCFVNDGNTLDLVRLFIFHLNLLSKEAYEKSLIHYAPIIQAIDTHIQNSTEPELFDHDHPKCNPYAFQKNSLQNLKQRLLNHIHVLPVVGFNSGRYDLDVFKEELLQCLLECDTIKLVIKDGNNYKCLQSSKFRFLDVCQYIAPGFDYRTYLKSYNCANLKGFFPYEYITSLDCLTETHFPPKSQFSSKLSITQISDDDYLRCKQIFEDNAMTLRDYLIYYNLLDTQPFVEALTKQRAVYWEKGIDMLRDFISAPDMARQWLFTTYDTNSDSVMLIDKRNSDLYYDLRANIVGGPSIVFHRMHEKDKTFIRNNKVCKTICGFDSNALYLYSMMQKMPVGSPVRRDNQTSPPFHIHPEIGASQVGFEWISFLSQKFDIEILHARNHGEVRLGQRRLLVDGYSPKQGNLVFQFYGCFWHGHKCSITQGKSYNHVSDKTFFELAYETKQSELYLEKIGYHVISIKECEWCRLKQSCPEVKSFIGKLPSRSVLPTNTTEGEIIDAVHSGKLFGILEVDIHVPAHLKEHFAEMTPIFKNVKIDSATQIGEHMAQHLCETGEKVDSKALIGSYFATKQMFLSPLLQWYLEHGLIITKIYQVIEYKGSECFVNFGNEISNSRRLGDIDSEFAMLAETSKLTGNSAYGKLITDIERFSSYRYVLDNDTEVSKLLNDSNFLSMNEVNSQLYEVEMCPARVDMNVPVHLGFSILNYAKLRMLQFYYDFLLRFVSPHDFQLMCMDTDSLYLALSGNSLEQLVPLNLHKQFQDDYSSWFPRQYCDKHNSQFFYFVLQGRKWVMDPCCKKVYDFDRRTPGLFKLEYQGDGCIALNSKTYFCFGDKNKVSAKGVNKSQNVLTKSLFLGVLNSKNSHDVSNRGFRVLDNRMYTYSQSRVGLNYKYFKRKVAQDGISTTPLEV